MSNSEIEILAEKINNSECLEISKDSYYKALEKIEYVRSFEVGYIDSKEVVVLSIVSFLQCGISLLNAGVRCVDYNYDYITIRTRDFQKLINNISDLIVALIDDIKNEGHISSILESHFKHIDSTCVLIEGKNKPNDEPNYLDDIDL